MRDLHFTLQRAAIGVLLLDIAIVAAVAIGFGIMRLNGGQLLTVQSDSMTPLFGKGDALITEPAASQSLSVGEVVSYHSPADPGVIVSHRLVARDRMRGQLVTAGDRLGSNDQPVASGQLVGRVTTVLPGFGRLVDVMRRPYVLIMLVYIPGVVLLFRELLRLAKYLNSPQYQLPARR